MRSHGLEGATTSNDTCLHEGQAEGNVREEAEDGVRSQAAGTTCGHQRPAEAARLLCGAPGGGMPCNTSDFGLRPSRPGREQLPVVSGHSVGGSLSQQPRYTNADALPPGLGGAGEGRGSVSQQSCWRGPHTVLRAPGSPQGAACHPSFLSYRGQARATSPCPPVPWGGRHRSSWPPKRVEGDPLEVLSGGAQASLKASDAPRRPPARTVLSSLMSFHSTGPGAQGLLCSELQSPLSGAHAP